MVNFNNPNLFSIHRQNFIEDNIQLYEILRSFKIIGWRFHILLQKNIPKNTNIPSFHIFLTNIWGISTMSKKKKLRTVGTKMCSVFHRSYLHYLSVMVWGRNITDINPECMRAKDVYWTFAVCLWNKLAVTYND